MRQLKHTLALLLALSTLGLAGCLGSVILVVTPGVITVGVGETITFSVTTVAGTAVVGATWSITSGVGAIDSATGLYTAPATGITEVTTVEVQAAKGTSAGTATVVIRPQTTVLDPIGDQTTVSDWDSLATGSGTPYETHLATLTLPQTPTLTFDITKVQTNRTATALEVTLTVSPNPTLAAAGATVGADNLAGFVDFDTDENSATGVPSANVTFCPSPPAASAIGSDFFVSLFARNADGTFNVFNSSATDVGDVTVTTNLNTVTLSVLLADLGGDDGRLAFNTVMGNGQDPNDCAPDQGGATVTVTEE